MLFTSRLTLFLTSCCLLGFSGLWSGSVIIARNGVAPHYLDTYLQESSNVTLLRRKHALEHFVHLRKSRDGRGRSGGGVTNKEDTEMTMTANARRTVTKQQTNHQETSIHKVASEAQHRAVDALKSHYMAAIQKVKNAKEAVTKKKTPSTAKAPPLKTTKLVNHSGKAPINLTERNAATIKKNAVNIQDTAKTTAGIQKEIPTNKQGGAQAVPRKDVVVNKTSPPKQPLTQNNGGGGGDLAASTGNVVTNKNSSLLSKERISPQHKQVDGGDKFVPPKATKLVNKTNVLPKTKATVKVASTGVKNGTVVAKTAITNRTKTAMHNTTIAVGHSSANVTKGLQQVRKDGHVVTKMEHIANDKFALLRNKMISSQKDSTGIAVSKTETKATDKVIDRAKTNRANKTIGNSTATRKEPLGGKVATSRNVAVVNKTSPVQTERKASQEITKNSVVLPEKKTTAAIVPSTQEKATDIVKPHDGIHHANKTIGNSTKTHDARIGGKAAISRKGIVVKKTSPTQTERKASQWIPKVGNGSNVLPKKKVTEANVPSTQEKATHIVEPHDDTHHANKTSGNSTKTQESRIGGSAATSKKAGSVVKKTPPTQTEQTVSQMIPKVSNRPNVLPEKKATEAVVPLTQKKAATDNTKTLLRNDNTAAESRNKSLHHNPTNLTRGLPEYLLKEPTSHACDGYRGVLLIQSGDAGAAAGTAFFQYVINQITFAEKYKFLPWIHFNNVSQHVYDPLVHGGTNTTIKAKSGMMITLSQVRAPNRTRLEGMVYPHSPLPSGKRNDTDFRVSGTGVWTSYFEPVSDFRKGDKSCERLPLITMSYDQLRGMHLYAPWAVRSWQYMGMPPHYFASENQTLQEWFAPMRRRAHEIVKKYYRFQPHIVQAVNRVLPENETCLGLHIRHSDKWGARRQIPEEEFLPYVKAFLQHGGNTVYLATDDQNVIDVVRTKWPSWVRKHIKTQGDNSVVRSTYQKPVFKIGEHHRTNTEVLNEILALSRCQWMVHGLSAVSESAIYLNLDLHNKSANLEDPSRMTVAEFGATVKQDLQEMGKRKMDERTRRLRKTRKA